MDDLENLIGITVTKPETTNKVAFEPREDLLHRFDTLNSIYYKAAFLHSLRFSGKYANQVYEELIEVLRSNPKAIPNGKRILAAHDNFAPEEVKQSLKKNRKKETIDNYEYLKQFNYV
jgi:hypothetical protein